MTKKALYSSNRQSSRIATFDRVNAPSVMKESPLPQVVTVYTESEETIAELLINKIIDKNGEGSNIYGVTGAATYLANDYIQDKITNNKINYIHSSNESAGIYMAAYEAEITGKVGVHFCTAGPGTAMATTAIGSLFNETKPAVIIFGVPGNNFQYIDRGIMAGITKKIIYIDKTTVNPQTLIDDAFNIAVNGTTEFPGQGPVALFVNSDMWREKYTTTAITQPYVRNVNQVVITQMINKISQQINSLASPRIIIRVGERVSIENIEKLAKLTNTHTNIYLHLTYLSKTYIDSTSYTNVGIEGPMGNTFVNTNYADADIVIDIANSINYSLIVYPDVKLIMSQTNSSIFYCLDQNLPYKPVSATPANTIMTDPNEFVLTLINMINNKSNLSGDLWLDTKNNQNQHVNDLVNSYVSQINNSVPTTAAILAQVLKTIYSLQLDPNKKLICDNHLYSSDVGASSFIFDSIVIHEKINHNLNFGEFSAIGCSLAAAAGRMRTTTYGDLICVIGDGGFLNVPGYLIDLINVIMAVGSTKRCLFIFLNDHQYSNVALAEEVKFGQVTSITSTAEIQKHLNCVNMITAMLGEACIKKLEVDTSLTDLDTFVDNWYKKGEGYTTQGFYLISYTTTDGTPHVEHQ